MDRAAPWFFPPRAFRPAAWRIRRTPLPSRPWRLPEPWPWPELSLEPWPEPWLEPSAEPSQLRGLKVLPETSPEALEHLGPVASSNLDSSVDHAPHWAGRSDVLAPRYTSQGPPIRPAATGFAMILRVA